MTPVRAAFHLEQNICRQNFAKFHPPLVERIDVPDNALDEILYAHTVR